MSFPRGVSLRAASAARLFCAVLLLGGCAGEPAPPLPALNIDGDRVAVAGLSSGAFMATQAHLAYSDRLRGAALIGGGPYGCANGVLETALGSCMQGTPAPDVEALAARVRERASKGELAPLSGLAGDRVFVLNGRGDATVAPALGAASVALYRALAGEDIALREEMGHDFGHVWPTVDRGGDCREPASPWIGACGFDTAGEVMAWLFGDAGTAPANEAAGELREFAQTTLLPADAAATQLAERGLAYVPPACAAGESCGLLIVFHGCEQSAAQVGDVFARDSGFNRWADVQRVVVLYPQVQPSWLPLNPKACWDWWGYTGADYDVRGGAQLGWVWAALEALVAEGKR